MDRSNNHMTSNGRRFMRLHQRVGSAQAMQEPYDCYGGHAWPSPAAKRHQRNNTYEFKSRCLDSQVNGCSEYYGDDQQDVRQEMMAWSGSGAVPTKWTNQDQCCFQRQKSREPSQPGGSRRSANSNSNAADLIAQAYAKRRQINQNRSHKHLNQHLGIFGQIAGAATSAQDSEGKSKRGKEHATKAEGTSRQGHHGHNSNSQMVSLVGLKSADKPTLNSSAMRKRDDDGILISQFHEEANDFDSDPEKLQNYNKNQAQNFQNQKQQKKTTKPQENGLRLPPNHTKDKDSAKKTTKENLHPTNPLHQRHHQRNFTMTYINSRINSGNKHNDQNFDLFNNSQGKNYQQTQFEDSNQLHMIHFNQPLDARDLNMGQHRQRKDNSQSQKVLLMEWQLDDVSQGQQYELKNGDQENLMQCLSEHQRSSHFKDGDFGDCKSIDMDLGTCNRNWHQQSVKKTRMVPLQEAQNRVADAAKEARRASRPNSYGRSGGSKSRMSRKQRASMQESYLRTLMKEETGRRIEPDQEKEEEAQQYHREQQRAPNNQYEDPVDQANQESRHQGSLLQYQLNSHAQTTPDGKNVEKNPQNGTRYRTKMSMQEQADEVFGSSRVVACQQRSKKPNNTGSQARSTLMAKIGSHISPRRSPKRQRNRKPIASSHGKPMIRHRQSCQSRFQSLSVMVNDDLDSAQIDHAVGATHSRRGSQRLSQTQSRRMKIQQRRQLARQRKSMQSLLAAEQQGIEDVHIFDEKAAFDQSQSLSLTMKKAADKPLPSSSNQDAKRPELHPPKNHGSQKSSLNQKNRNLMDQIDQALNGNNRVDTEDIEEEMNRLLHQEIGKHASKASTFTNTLKEGEVRRSSAGAKADLGKSPEVNRSSNQINADNSNSKVGLQDSAQGSSKENEQSIEFQKDMLVLKLNQRLTRLNQQKDAGDVQFEKSSLQLKESYKRIHQKVDEIENQAMDQLRSHLFIRQQKFSQMVSQIQSQIDELDRQTCRDETTGRQNLMQYSQVFEFAKSNIDQVVNQADKFLANEKHLQAQTLAEKPVVSSTRSPSKSCILEAVNGRGGSAKARKLVEFPNFSSEGLTSLLKVKLNFAGLNSEKFNLTNSLMTQTANSAQPQGHKKMGAPHHLIQMESTLKAVAATLHKIDGTNFPNRLKRFTTSPGKKIAFSSTFNPGTSSSNLISNAAPIPVPSRKTDKINSNTRHNDSIPTTLKSQNDQVHQKPSKSLTEKAQIKTQPERDSEHSNKKRGFLKTKPIMTNFNFSKQPTFKNYQLIQETERTPVGSVRLGSSGMASLKNSPILKTLQSSRTMNHNKMTSKYEKYRSPRQTKRTLNQSQLNQDLDFDFENQQAQSLGSSKMELKSQSNQPSQEPAADSPTKAKKKKIQLFQMTKKSIASIQNHIQRIQTCGSMETLERNGGAGVQEAYQDKFKGNKQSENSILKDTLRTSQSAAGGLAQAPSLSNMKQHQGHAFGQSESDTRRNPLTAAAKVKTTSNKGDSGFSFLAAAPQASGANRGNVSNAIALPQSRFNGQDTEMDQQKTKYRKQSRYGSQDLSCMTEIRQRKKHNAQDSELRMGKQLSFADRNPGREGEEHQDLAAGAGGRSKARKQETDRADPEGNGQGFESRQLQKPARKPSSISEFHMSQTATIQHRRGPSEQKQAPSQNGHSQAASAAALPKMNSGALLNNKNQDTKGAARISQQRKRPQVIRSRDVIRREGSISSNQSPQPSNLGNLGLQHHTGDARQQSNQIVLRQANSKLKRTHQADQADKEQTNEEKEATRSSEKRDQIKNKKGTEKAKKQIILMTHAPEPEQQELNLISQMFTRKRIFTKIISQTDRIQFQWSHPTNYKEMKAQHIDSPDLQYVLEYGCGIKISGVEQFRKIYQGKAHKCIVADLMPKTMYRFRVCSTKVDKDEMIKPENAEQWSDIVAVQTLGN